MNRYMHFVEFAIYDCLTSFRFMNPQSMEEKEEENEKSMPIDLKFYSIDDVEPVDTPDGGFAPDYTCQPPKYINEILKSKLSPRDNEQFYQSKELNIITSDVSVLSKKLLEIQEQVSLTIKVIKIIIEI